MPLTLRIYRLRVVLTLTQTTELFPFQSAIVHALLSEANGRGGRGSPCIPDGLMLDAPELCCSYFQAGDPFAFGFTLLAGSEVEAKGRLQRLRNGLMSVGQTAPAGKPVLGGNFTVDLVEDLVAQQPLESDSIPQPVDNNQIQAEIDRLSRCSQATLRFVSPLRFHRPKNDRADGHAFFDDTYFSAELLLQRTGGRIRALGLDVGRSSREEANAPQILRNDLTWIDIAYGKHSSRKTLGGVMGSVTIDRLRAEDAATLVWGQYLRIGEGTNFGFGHYEIIELGPPRYRCHRSRPLLEWITTSDRIDEVASQYRLESGALMQAAAQLRSGTYQPESPRMTEIASKGRLRQLSIPQPLDAALQRCVLDVIGPALDRLFSESSLAYRKGLGRHSAAKRIRDSYREGYRWAVRSDFHRFFDSVDHSLLRARLSAYLGDEPLAEIIMRWIQSSPEHQSNGLPTGAVLSPLLSNLFLDRFDFEISKSQGRLVRYADDFLILFKTFEEADELYQQTKQVVKQLGLELNVDATDWFPLNRNFQFLGFCFHADGDWDSMQMSPPKELADLGWYERHSRRAVQGRQFCLPGESQRPAAGTRKSTLIVGPNLESLVIEHRRLAVRYATGKSDSLPLHRVGNVTVLGPVDLSAATLSSLVDYSIGVTLCSESGYSLSHLYHAEQVGEHADLVIAQVALLQDSLRSLALAKQLIAAKILNYAALADSVPGRHDDQETGAKLRDMVESVRQAESLESLLGHEGTAARIWYSRFNARLPLEYRFDKRVSPQASDPINVLLNIGQTFLYRQIDLMLQQAGFVTSLGILHRPKPGHACLASDIQEPFRHLVDRAVIEVSAKLRPADFRTQTKGRFALAMSPIAARRYIQELHRMLTLECQAESSAEPASYRDQMGRVIRSLRRHFRQGSDWFVFRHPSQTPAKGVS